MENYEFIPLTNNREIEDLKSTYGQSLEVFRPEFINADIPPDRGFIEDKIECGHLPEDHANGIDRRTLTLHVAVDGFPTGDGAENVAKLIAHLGYVNYKPYMLSYWMSDVPHKIKVLFYVR